MPEKAEFEAALSRIESYAKEFEIEIIEKEVTEFDEDETNVDVHHLMMETNSGERFYISAKQDLQYFRASFDVNLMNSISMRLSDEESNDIISDAEAADDIELKQTPAEVDLQASAVLLARADQEALIKLSECVNIISSGDGVLLDTYSSENVSFYRAHLYNSIFPFESDFNFRRFANAVQELVARGNRTTNLFQLSIDVMTPEETDSEKYELNVDIPL